MKMLIVSFTLLVVLLTTGCDSSKTLSCSYEKVTNDLLSTSVISIKYEEDLPVLLKITSSIDLGDDAKKVDASLYKGACDGFLEEMDCEVSMEGTNVVINATSEDATTLATSNTIDYESFKNQYEGMGYTCK